MTRRNLVLWLALAAPVALALRAPGAEYYFSVQGDDLAGDGTLASPWRSIGKFNALDLDPGDQAFFRRGDSFAGRLYLDEQDSGTNAVGELVAPIRIGAYGAAAARPRIVSPVNSEALFAYNNGGLEIDGLEFLGGGHTSGPRKSGVQFFVDKSVAALQKYHHVRVTNVVSSGFSSSGLDAYAASSVGYADVQITDSEFFGNAFSGVTLGAGSWQNLVHANVTIDRVLAHDNPGYAGASPHSGHGVVVGQVDGAVIQRSAAYNNGASHGAGNVGIWAWQANDVAIRGNIAYGNRSPDGPDGGAFDLDGGVTNSVVEYNRSFDNDGAGLLLAQFASAEPMQRNVFRYNVSVNDGRDGYGAMTVWGNSAADLAQSAVFHNNSVFVDQAAAPHSRGTLWFLGDQHRELAFINNSFTALNGAALVAGATTAAKAALVGNAYWTAGAPIVLEDAVFASVEDWAASEGQERLAGQFVGGIADPQFADLQTLRPYAYSPLVDAGRSPGAFPWPTWVASLGPRDAAGAAIAQGPAPDVGAWEVVLADFDGNALVDGDDLSIWSGEFGAGAAPQRAADLDGDAIVDGREFLVWQRRVGQPASSSRAVPEPHGWLLVALLACGPLRRPAAQRRPG